MTKLPLATLLFISCLLFALPALSRDMTQADAGGAAYCFDGDTFKLRDRRVARLAGIDAPEVAHGGKKAQYYAQEAKQALIELVKGKQVDIEYPGVKDRDRYGRLIVEVKLPDGLSINEAMVERGAAFFYPHEDLGPEFQERLREAQAEAIQERRGMWAKLLDMPVAEQRFVGNKNSLRFFPANCPAAHNLKPRNRVNFDNLMDAFLAGYAPARICPFWPDAASVK